MLGPVRSWGGAKRSVFGFLFAIFIASGGCRAERPDPLPAQECECDCGDDIACPPPAQSTLIVEGAKGDGPVRVFFPGLNGRPILNNDHVEALDAALKKSATETKIPGYPAPGMKSPQTMTVYAPPRKAGRFPRGVPDGWRDRHSMHLSVEPYVRITPEGKALIRWETWLKTPPTFIHFGLRVPDQILDYPRFKLASTSEEKTSSKTHEAILTLSRLEKPIVDIVGFAEHGGVVDYRIEFSDPSLRLTNFFEGRFSYVKEGELYRAGVTLTEGPFVDLPSPEGMTISFETDTPTIGAVVLVPSAGTLAPVARVFTSAKASQRHEIRVTGLSPDTLYTYRAAAIDARGVIGWMGDYALRTAPKTMRPFRFSVMSDSRSALGGGEHWTAGSNHRILRSFMSESLKLGADFILFPGDMVNGYTTQKRWLELQLEGWKRAIEPVGHYIPIFEGMGNHELLFDRRSEKKSYRLDRASPDSTEDVFAQEFVNPTNGPPPERAGLPPYRENVYSFDYGSVHFVSINTNYWISSSPGREGNREGFIMENQMAWLKEDLRSARSDGASFIIVFTHEPGFPNGGHHRDAMYWRGKIGAVNTMRTEFWSLMSDFAVDIVFHGDEHNYSRLLIDDKMDPSFTHPVWQIVTGGCGAPYYAQSTHVPWASRVVKFSAQEHFVMVDILNKTQAVVTAIGRNGELLDRFTIQRKTSP